jgi:1-acyl-sn-glycerol-3-phosphate acyltransferase
MMRSIWLATALGILTLLLGTVAIVLMVLIPTGSPLFWMARPWARAITWLSGTRVIVSGRDHVPAGGSCVYMSNHQSHFDVLALVIALPGQYRILAKRVLFYIPVMGWAMWLAGFIPVDRSKRDKAIRSIDRAAEMARRGRSILIFAEGTRSEDGRLQPLKKGGFVLAIKAGAPIVPVSITGSREVLPKGGRTVRPGVIRVVIGRPIDTSACTIDAMEGLVERVRESLLAGMKEIPTPAT